MKYHNHTFTKASLMASALGICVVSHGATVIGPDGFGNVNVFPADTDDVRIVVTTTPLSPDGQAEILVQPGAAVAPTTAVLGHGIDLGAAATGYTINNNGTIAAPATFNGITTAATGTIVNNNTGASITGGATGVAGANGLALTNNGTITGGTGDGVSAGDGLALTNHGTIQTTGGDGVRAGNGAAITNHSSILTAGSDGIQVGNNASITNHGTIDNTGTNSDGINAGTGLSLTNNGLIQTTGDDGVQAGTGSTIDNNAGATIRGVYGVYAPDGGVTVNNRGTIVGTADDGILSDGNSPLIVHNWGRIEGDYAIDGDTALDEIYLYDGSTVIGDIVGGGDDDNDLLTFTGGLTSPSDPTGNWVEGNVEMERIVKNGTGTAFIWGEYVEANTIDVDEGGLTINADISMPEVDVLGDGEVVMTKTGIVQDGGSELGGTGTWDANVAILTGTFSPGEEPIDLAGDPWDAVGETGALEVTGDVHQSAASTFRWDVNPHPEGGHDQLWVSGDGNVFSVEDYASMMMSPTNVDGVVLNGSYTIIDTEEIIDGPADADEFLERGVHLSPNVWDGGDFWGTETEGGASFDTVIGNYFTALRYSADGTDLIVDIEHDFGGLPGLTKNEAALGEAIDEFVENGHDYTDDVDDLEAAGDFIAALDYSDLATVQDTLAAMLPEPYFGLGAAVVNNNYRLHRMAQNHLAFVRAGGEHTVTETVPSSDPKGGVPQTTTTVVGGRGNLWGGISYDWQDYDGGSSVRDYDGETGALTVGFDWRVAPNFVIGGLLDASSSDYDGGYGSSSDIDSFRVAAYGTWGGMLGFYSDFLLGYGDHDLSLDRKPFVGIANVFANRGSTDATSWQAMATFGYNWGDESLQHGPFGGLEYQNVDFDSFVERGPVPIGVSDFDLDSLRGLIGYRAQGCYNKFRPFGMVAYAHEFEDDPTSVRANLGGKNGPAFRVEGPEQASAVLLGLGCGFAVTDSLLLDLGYRGEIAVDGDGIDSHGATLGVNWSF